MMLPENCKIVRAIQTEHGSAEAGDWVCLKGYRKAMCIFSFSTGADDTEVTVTVDKASSVAGADESAGITLNNYWTLFNMVQAGPTSDTMTKGAAAASISTVTDQATDHLIVIDIDAEELPTTTVDFDCVQLTVSASNAAHFQSAVWVLYEPRYAMSTPITAIA
jgi:hypothetical protein